MDQLNMHAPSSLRKTLVAFAIVAATIFHVSVSGADEPVVVNIDNFVRAETAAQFDRFVRGPVV